MSQLDSIFKVLITNKVLQEKYLEKFQLLRIRLDQLESDISDLEMAIRDDRRSELQPSELQELEDYKELQSDIKSAIPLLLLSMLNKIDLNSQ